MDVASYILLGQGQALRRRMEVVANNMANVSTSGFKREQPQFHALVTRSGSPGIVGADSSRFVLDRGAVHDLSQGAFTQTGNALDVMIAGDGYFTIRAPDGQDYYSRNGQFGLTGSGALVTQAGDAVLDSGGQPIVVPPDQRAGLTIGRDGSLTADGQIIARIGVVRFADQAPLEPRGNSRFAAPGLVAQPVDDPTILSGGIEASNVQPVQETTTMIEVLRSYQSSVRMAESIADLRRRSIERLSKPSY